MILATAEGDLWQWLGGADNVTATAVAVVFFGGLIRALWRRTAGHRRLVRSSVEQMAVRVNEEYVRNLFGVPAYGRTRDGNGDLVWVTPYLHVLANFRNGSVNGFVVTVIDPTFLLPLKSISLGKFDGFLGRQTFASTSRHDPESQSLSVGARRFSYREVYYYGNPGGYLHYMLAVNDSSAAGRFELPPGVTSGVWVGGEASLDASKAVNHMSKYCRPNTVGIYLDYAYEAPPAALDADDFRLLPADTSRWRGLERAVARAFRPF